MPKYSGINKERTKPVDAKHGIIYKNLSPRLYEKFGLS